MVALELGMGCDGGGVGTRVGLGQPEAEDVLSFGHIGEKPPFLFFGAVQEDGLSAVGHDSENPKGQVQHGVSGFFQQDGQVNEISTDAPVFLGDGQPQPPFLRQCLQRFGRRPFLLVTGPRILPGAVKLQNGPQRTPKKPLGFREVQIQSVLPLEFRPPTRSQASARRCRIGEEALPKPSCARKT